jgi:hypothetical protein
MEFMGVGILSFFNTEVRRGSHRGTQRFLSKKGIFRWVKGGKGD